MLFFRLFRRSFILSGLSGMALVAAGGAAFTAANTVPATVAGSGSGGVSGYTVSGVVYNLNASNPQNIDSVTFAYSPGAPDPTKARASLNNGTTWFNCDSAIVGGSDSVTACATSGATVAGASTLIVVLSQ
ncbi:MAG: hypothetical protein EPO65_07795 [Dehalococcoidia bacterium]|nr:MAG: hypothetical protein EPO65_07795 [Dehalococcoidia bacterium]